MEVEKNNRNESVFESSAGLENLENQSLSEKLNVGTLKESLRFPKYFEVETVNACNARCVMCTINDWEKTEDVLMGDNLFNKFVNEVIDHSDWIEAICLNRDGEPTLDNKLHQKIKALKEVGIKDIRIATHGQQLDSNRVNQYIDSGLDMIMVSIDGFTKETFEAIRAGLDFDTVIKNTLNLIKIRDQRKSKMVIRVRMVIMEKNQNEVKDWFAFWKSKVGEQDQVYAKPIHTWGNQLGKESDELIDFYSSVPCVLPFSTMVIPSDGRIPLCGVDYNSKMLLGEFAKQTIEEIWNNDKFMEIRRLHLMKQRNEISMCQGCHIWEEEHKQWG
jgi:radical SAM protein with 4Fe4S-binding SPASM domain